MSLQTASYQAVRRDLTIIFNKTAKAAKPIWPTFCTQVTSTGKYENYAWLGDLPGMREWIGPREFKQLRAADFLLKNRKWESSLEFLKDDIDDDQTGEFRPRIEALANEATYHPDELLFEVMNKASTEKCFDGQYFFDTDHQWGDSGTQSNIVSQTIVDADKPTAAEFLTSFHAGLIRLLSFKNDQGKPFFRPKVEKLGNLVAVVPLNMYEAAEKAFAQQYVSGGESNFSIERPTIVPSIYSGDSSLGGTSTKWRMYYTGGRIKPFVMQARKPLQFQVKGDNDIEFQELKAMTEARYNVGLGMWAFACEIDFSE